ncbi:alpha/beta fold hydrolase [Nocardia sp. NPDC050406]|uniref:alpha/beta fold hydrolase n=1 Tax=Nocardia sp. NPDC050406 TaxID=3364318 RepID=UPI00378A95FB
MPNFQTADGTTLAYEDYGTGTPIVFIAGWSLFSDMWEHQLYYFLEHGYRCVLLDRRGHGRSDRPSSGYDVDTRADDIATLLEHLDLTGATMVAHSAGGAEAVRYLARHGEARVDRLVLLAAAVPSLLQTEDNPLGVPKEMLDWTLNALRTDRFKWLTERAQGYFATHLGNDVSPALIENEIRRCMSVSPYASLEVQRALMFGDHTADLEALTVPTLIMHGPADQSVPIDPTSRRAARLIANNVYKELPTAGHGMYVTHAAEINADIMEFMKA